MTRDFAGRFASTSSPVTVPLAGVRAAKSAPQLRGARTRLSRERMIVRLKAALVRAELGLPADARLALHQVPACPPAHSGG